MSLNIDLKLHKFIDCFAFVKPDNVYDSPSSPVLFHSDIFTILFSEPAE